MVLMTRHFDYRPSASKGDYQIEGSSAPVVSRWLGGGNRTFLEAASMVVSWWLVAFLRCVTSRDEHDCLSNCPKLIIHTD